MSNHGDGDLSKERSLDAAVDFTVAKLMAGNETLVLGCLRDDFGLRALECKQVIKKARDKIRSLES